MTAGQHHPRLTRTVPALANVPAVYRLDNDQRAKYVAACTELGYVRLITSYNRTVGDEQALDGTIEAIADDGYGGPACAVVATRNAAGAVIRRRTLVTTARLVRVEELPQLAPIVGPLAHGTADLDPRARAAAEVAQP